MTRPEFEERLAILEAEVARLKAIVEKGDQSTRPFFRSLAGSFANDPAFDEAMRLGREYRESLRPDDDCSIEQTFQEQDNGPDHA